MDALNKANPKEILKYIAEVRPKNPQHEIREKLLECIRLQKAGINVLGGIIEEFELNVATGEKLPADTMYGMNLEELRLALSEVTCEMMQYEEYLQQTSATPKGLETLRGISIPVSSVAVAENMSLYLGSVQEWESLFESDMYGYLIDLFFSGPALGAKVIALRNKAPKQILGVYDTRPLKTDPSKLEEIVKQFHNMQSTQPLFCRIEVYETVEAKTPSYIFTATQVSGVLNIKVSSKVNP